MKLFFTAAVFTALFSTYSGNAQVKNDSLPKLQKDTIVAKKVAFKKGEEYILGGISVTGLKKFSEETVRVFTGLVYGQTIKLPGDKLTSAIKKLYESKQFSDVDVYLERIDGNTIYLQLAVQELPQLNEIEINGIKKSKAKELIKETELKLGKMVTDNLLVTTKNYITKKYTDKGFLKTKVSLDTQKDTSDVNIVNMSVFVDKGRKIKIKNINFIGNTDLSNKKLRKAMKNTKEKFFGRFWKGSKYIEEEYQEDLEGILDAYSRMGYRDARILKEGISWNEKNTIDINIDIEEGRQYRFAEILFVGNKEYTDEQLQQVLKIDKGDVYNGAVLKERVSGDGSPTSFDISSEYQNNGYLFSQVNAVETRVKNDSITVEIRIREDEKARIKKVSVTGNDKTNDHVIFRELRVKPGDLFSRREIIRSIREIGQLGFFDQNVTPDVIPNYQNKTADIDFSVIEKGGSQIELQGGYGGGSFIGTLGLSFNNFSIKNLFNKEFYKPLPTGDGQQLSLRLQSSRTYNTYSFSFTEPWFGGKKPKSLSFSIYQSNQGPSLIFPTYGSEFSFGLKATLPYSLISKRDFIEPDNLTAVEQNDFLAEKFKWLEYYKVTVKGKWYTAFTDKLVLMTNAELGFLGFYNDKLGQTPFERYFVGGDGIAQFQLDGRETVGLRGYENNRLSSISGGTIYNKFQLELRFSITDAPSASIYTLGFVEAGNSYDNFDTYNPFELKRSAGVGVRIFMPAFGLLGIDFAHGFDPLPGQAVKSGWQTHFIIGRQF